jgi:hypothetical protein
MLYLLQTVFRAECYYSMIAYANFKELEGRGSDLSQYGSLYETLRIVVLDSVF